MKSLIIILCFAIGSVRGSAQSHEIQQLLLDIEKLAQFKEILSDLKQGYSVLVTGYDAVKDISEGNFNLHKSFLDGLLEVSPAVRKYWKIKEVLETQGRLIREAKKLKSRLLNAGQLHGGELAYLEKVFDRLMSSSLSQISELLKILTAGEMRMTDKDRIDRIDGIWNEVNEQYDFFRRFSQAATVLSANRSRESQMLELDRKIRN